MRPRGPHPRASVASHALGIFVYLTASAHGMRNKGIGFSPETLVFSRSKMYSKMVKFDSKSGGIPHET